MASYEEKKRHSSKLVPFSYYKCMIPDYFINVPLHWHSEFEINYILSGCAKFICGDSQFVSAEDDIIIIPPNVLHSIYPHENSGQLYDTVVFSSELLGVSENNRCAAECVRPLVNGTSKVTARITRDHVFYSELKIIVENIFSCAKGDTPHLDMLMKSELLRLFRLPEESGDIFRGIGNAESKIEAVRPAIEYMNKNFAENITVGRLAEIAYECGFRNLSNFNRQFMNIVGCTPKQYRKMNLS